MKEHVIPCSCYDFHFMRFTVWPEDWEQKDFRCEAYLSIGGNFWKSWRDRVKGMWHVLRGCESHSNEILLDRDKAIMLRNALEEYLWDVGYEAAPFHSCVMGCPHPPRQDVGNFGGLL